AGLGDADGPASPRLVPAQDGHPRAVGRHEDGGEVIGVELARAVAPRDLHEVVGRAVDGDHSAPPAPEPNRLPWRPPVRRSRARTMSISADSRPAPAMTSISRTTTVGTRSCQTSPSSWMMTSATWWTSRRTTAYRVCSGSRTSEAADS